MSGGTTISPTIATITTAGPIRIAEPDRVVGDVCLKVRIAREEALRIVSGAVAVMPVVRTVRSTLHIATLTPTPMPMEIVVVSNRMGRFEWTRMA
jgi:hypothetical protein